MKYKGITGIIVLAASLFSCKPAEVLLHGDIAGIVSDNETSQPIQSALVTLTNTDDTTRSMSDGSFLIKNIIPDKYEIQSSKTGYDISKKNVTVLPAETEQVDFPLNGIPVPHYSSTCLDFGLDSTTLSLTISNLGKGRFLYLINKDQNWISVSPSSGEVTNESGKIRITIDRTGLSANIYNGLLELTLSGPGILIQDTIHVNLNGVADQECNYYKVVKIGTQIWMAENLNIGSVIDIHQEPADNKLIEKWCSDCKTYGGLYTWYEAMNYNPADNGATGKTQGICPVGWHIPTENEVNVLSNFLGGDLYSGAKLKATGNSLWQSPNYATNESGFTALPGGSVDIDNFSLSSDNNSFSGYGYSTQFWESNLTPDLLIQLISDGSTFFIQNDKTLLIRGYTPAIAGSSVRCLKNPAK